MPDTVPAPPAQPQSSQPSQPSQWDEEAYEKALAHLEQLQDQLQSLRTTLPSLIRPLTHLRPSSPSHPASSTSLSKYTTNARAYAPHATTQQTFTRLSKSAKTALADVSAFRTTWTSEPTQRILQEAKRSADSRSSTSSGGVVTKGDASKGDSSNRGGVSEGRSEEEVPVWGWVELCEGKYGRDGGLGDERGEDAGGEREGRGDGRVVRKEEVGIDVKMEMTDGEGVVQRGIKRDSEGIVKMED